MKITATILLTVLIIMTNAAGYAEESQYWWEAQQGPEAPAKEYDDFERNSFYIKMKDGVELAADVYIPKNSNSAAAKDKYPAILSQTRYWRSYDPRPGMEAQVLELDMRRSLASYFVPHGYAYVVVDVRGTGASFGARASEFDEQEIKDTHDVVSWIVDQPWSDGTVGATGVSYPGTTAEFALYNAHPAMKAVAPLYAGWDFYRDVTHPGGIPNDGFNRIWLQSNAALDQNMAIGGGAHYALGVNPVAGREDDLERAVADHQDNNRLAEAFDKVFYIDQPIEGFGKPAAASSPFIYRDVINESETPIFAVAGWYDSAYPRSALNRFMNTPAGQNHVLIGPWSHGGMTEYEPGLEGEPRTNAFDVLAEVLAFFDYHLKNEPNEFVARPLIIYHSTGSNDWRTAETWPPKGTVEKTFCFAGGAVLSEACRALPGQRDTYRVDLTTSAGNGTRWDTTLGGGAISYPDRSEEDAKIPAYTTDPLDEDVRMAGEAVVSLYVESEEAHADFIVYLSEVTRDGRVNYVTEGMLRSSMRKKTTFREYAYESAGPLHAFTKEAEDALVEGEVVNLEFGLIPNAHVFKAGNRIRVSIAATDGERFRSKSVEGAERTIWRSWRRQSSIVLPIHPLP